MTPRRIHVVEIDLLDFMRTCKQLTKQALREDAGKPAEGGLARWKHVVITYYRIEEGYSYRETENQLRCFAELREILELDPNDFPDDSTIYKSFDRFNMRVWRTLLRVSAEQHPQSGHIALDSIAENPAI